MLGGGGSEFQAKTIPVPVGEYSSPIRHQLGGILFRRNSGVVRIVIFGGLFLLQYQLILRLFACAVARNAFAVQ